MGRTVKDFQFMSEPCGLAEQVHAYLISEGCKCKQKNGETVYQKGSGLMMGPTFIKLTVANGGARLEGWQKMAILPGVYAGEIDAESFVGIAVKGPLKARLAYIENLIIQYGGRPVFPGMYQQPVNYQVPMQNPYQPPQSSQMPLSGNAQAHSDRAAFCTACGSALTQDSKFCTVCGKKVE